MEMIVWIGATLTLVGLGMLVWCIVSVARAKRAGLPDADLKARLQKIVALNLGALAVSGIGLMAVIVGIFLS
jgi:hypothetical protein